jgi:hypothetical protein
MEDQDLNSFKLARIVAGFLVGFWKACRWMTCEGYQAAEEDERMVRKGDDLVRGHVICSILGSARVEQEAQNRSRRLSEPEGWVGR